MSAALISENAKSFKAAFKELGKITRSTEVSHYLTNNRITWDFIVKKVPWLDKVAFGKEWCMGSRRLYMKNLLKFQ